ncbi:MAG: PAC2 family protein [Candidatus Woesearchaeota archaeon]
MMEIKLKHTPKNPIIIEGFPGIGLIATITTEFLIKHLNAEPIGSIWSKDIMPIAAVHDSKIVQPLEIFYDKKHNIVILHALSDVKGLEWDISSTLVDLYHQLGATEIISIEGIMSQGGSNNTYYLKSDEDKSQLFDSIKLGQLKEGIIVGVTAALLLKDRDIKTTGFFVETHSKLPDSKSAAKVVEVLNNYLKLELDTKPLMEAAEMMEKKIKALFEQTKHVMDHKKNMDIHYLG